MTISFEKNLRKEFNICKSVKLKKIQKDVAVLMFHVIKKDFVVNASSIIREMGNSLVVFFLMT
jgi:hypothetical protein